MEKEKYVHTSRPPIYEWTLDYENHPQEACETLVMLNIVMPGLPPEPLSYEIVVRFIDIPELINRYEYSYHPRPRDN